MSRCFQWLDDVLSQIVPIAYLVGMVAGTVAYFGGYIPSAPVAVATCVGLAAECHYWLQQRRIRGLYGTLYRLKHSDPKRDVLARNFKIQLGILILLGLFSAFSSNMFLSTYWHPLATVVPVWLQTMIRGSVIPVLLLERGTVGLDAFKRFGGEVRDPEVGVHRLAAIRRGFIHRGPQGGFDIGDGEPVESHQSFLRSGNTTRRQSGRLGNCLAGFPRRW